MTKRTPDDRGMVAVESKRIWDDNEPLRRIRAMQRAINLALIDLSMDESVDASEGLTGAELAQMLHNTGLAVTTLDAMYRRLR